MAGENDVFTVLGTVKVDMNTLKASLSAAEAEVQKSAQRQKASVDQMSKAATDSVFKRPEQGGTGKSTWWSDPNMAGLGGDGGPVGKGLKGIGAAAEHAGKGMHFTMLETRALSHVLSLAVPGMSGLGMGLASILTHLGPVGAGVAILAVTFGILAKRAEEVAKTNFEIKRSLATADFERLAGALTKANEALAEQVDLGDRANQQITGWQSFTDVVTSFWKKTAADITGTGVDAQREKLKKLQEGFKQAFSEFEGPKRMREIMRDLNSIEADSANRALAIADTNDKVNEGYDRLNKTLQTTHDLQVTDLELQFKQEAAKLGLVKGSKEYAQLREVTDAKIAAADTRMAESTTANVEAQKRKLAELATAQSDYTTKLEAEIGKRVQSDLDLRKSEIDSARETAQLRAATIGQTADATDAIGDSYRIQSDKIVESEKVAEMASERLIANLKAQIAAGIDIEANQRKIGEGEAARETGRQEAANKQKTLGLQRDRDLANEAKRVYDAEIGRITQTTAAYFGYRKSLGEDTLNGEIKAQEALNNLYVKGTAEYYNGLKKVADLQKQMREEAKSTFQQIAGAASESLKKRTGRKSFTAAELQTEAGSIEKQGEALFSQFGSNKAVDTDALLKAMGMQGGFERFAAQGGSLRERFQTAITQPGGFAEVGSEFGGGGPEVDTSKLMKASADLFRSGVADFTSAVKAFADASGGQNSPLSWLRDPVTHQASETMGRALYLDGKRAPADVSGAGT